MTDFLIIILPKSESPTLHSVHPMQKGFVCFEMLKVNRKEKLDWRITEKDYPYEGKESRMLNGLTYIYSKTYIHPRVPSNAASRSYFFSKNLYVASPPYKQIILYDSCLNSVLHKQ